MEILGSDNSRLLNGVLDGNTRLNILGLLRNIIHGELLGGNVTGGQGNLGHGLLNHRLVNGGVSNNLGSLDGLIVNVSFNSFLRNIFDFGFISILGNIFSDMLDLLIVGIGLLDGLISGLFNSLVFSHGLGNGDVFSSLLGDIFGILSFIRNLVLGDNWFIINILFLDGDIFNIRGGLRLGLLVDNLGLNNGLDQGLLINGSNGLDVRILRLDVRILRLAVNNVLRNLSNDLGGGGLHF